MAAQALANSHSNLSLNNSGPNGQTKSSKGGDLSPLLAGANIDMFNPQSNTFTMPRETSQIFSNNSTNQKSKTSLKDLMAKRRGMFTSVYMADGTHKMTAMDHQPTYVFSSAGQGGGFI